MLVTMTALEKRDGEGNCNRTLFRSLIAKVLARQFNEQVQFMFREQGPIVWVMQFELRQS